VQAINGPAATIFPSTAAPFAATAGTISPTQIFSLVNIGNQLLTINSISIVGPGASFSQSNTCLATLAPDAHCSISIVFNPAAAGTFTATLQVVDNAPGSPQTLSLSGNGLTPTPAITFSPPVLSFPMPPLAVTTQGTSSDPEVLSVFSTGNITLHISSVTLGGPNPSDFSFTNNCPATLAPSGNCTISVVFSPIAPGQRTATLTFSDDAPNSPQTVSLSGTAVSVVSGGPVPNGSTSATVSAGQPAQYQLQLTPGAGFTGSIGLIAAEPLSAPSARCLQALP
jgi:ASPM-SPD-2-Hydin domain-containing protein/centrosomal CEP192-like protein